MNEEPTNQTLALRHAFKVALSMALFYWFTLTMNWSLTQYGAFAIILCSLDTTGATIEKVLMRLFGTTIGIVVGFALISAFGEDRWLMLAGMAIYITLIGYGLQASRYAYGYYVAGFLPLVMWANTYPSYEMAWDYGAYRWLETVAGLVIYTVVDIVFWPRSSGAKLHRSGAAVWQDLKDYYDVHRSHLDDETGKRPDISELHASLASNRSAADFDLQQSLLDTPLVNAQRKKWNALRDSANLLISSLEHWGESAVEGKARNLPLAKLLPNLDEWLQRIDERFGFAQNQWKALFDTEYVVERSLIVRNQSELDRGVVHDNRLEFNETELAKLSYSHRAVAENFRHQLQRLDQASANAVQDLIWITGDKSAAPANRNSSGDDSFSVVYRPKHHVAERWILATYPAWVLGISFLFWVTFNPPAGAAQAQMAATIALAILQQRINPIIASVAIVVLIFTVAAPIIWIVMPALQTIEELLALLFVYSFVFTWLGAKSPALKLIPLLLLVTLANISNQQTYSFQGTTNAALMFALAGPMMSIPWFFMTPLRPESALVLRLNRFFDGYSRFLGGFFVGSVVDHSAIQRDQPEVDHGAIHDNPLKLTPATQAKNYDRRKTAIESLMLPTEGELRNILATLKFDRHADGANENLQYLLAAIQGLTRRSIALHEAHRQVIVTVSPIPASITEIGRHFQEEALRIVGEWDVSRDSQLETHRSLADTHELRSLVRRLEQEIEALSEVGVNSDIDDSTANSQQDLTIKQVELLFVLSGTMRGLSQAIKHCDDALRRINWTTFTQPRF